MDPPQVAVQGVAGPTPSAATSTIGPPGAGKTTTLVALWTAKAFAVREAYGENLLVTRGFRSAKRGHMLLSAKKMEPKVGPSVWGPGHVFLGT